MQRGEPAQAAQAMQHTFPAPIRGWVLNENLASVPPGAARILDNFAVTTSGIRPRGGRVKHATLGGAVKSLFTYKAGPTSNMFGTTAADIFDITAPADTDVAPVAAASGFTSGLWASQQFGTPGGDFLYAVNGADYAQIYDGTDILPVTAASQSDLGYDALVTDFAVGETVTGGTSGATATVVGINKSSATAGTLRLGAITGGPFQDNEAITSTAGEAVADGASASGSAIAITGVATTDLSHVWSFANRLFFVEGGTLSAWYLPVDSIGGAATEFSLAGIFRQGGSLLFGATWSLDAGDGLDDTCLFISTEGEVAVYRGTNPSSASDWAKVGVYQITKPLGARAIMQAGGDLIVATTRGLFPISQAINMDVAALEMEAVSKAIQPYWQSRAASDSATPWQIMKWPEKNVMIVSQPTGSASKFSCLVANLSNNGWSRYTGWDTQCLAYFVSNGYFGAADGCVYRMEVSGSDNGTPYTCKYLGHHEGLAVPFMQKTALQAQLVFSNATPVAPLAFATSDYSEALQTPPASVAEYGGAVWDVGLWDDAVWDGGTSGMPYVSLWTSIGVTGYSLAPEVQLTFGVSIAPEAELVAFNMTYTAGGLVN